MLLYLPPMSLIQVFRMLHLTRKTEISRRCPSIWAYTHSCQFDGYFPKPWLMDLNCWAMNSGVRIWDIGAICLGRHISDFFWNSQAVHVDVHCKSFEKRTFRCSGLYLWKYLISGTRTWMSAWFLLTSSVIAVKLSVLTYFNMIVKC